MHPDCILKTLCAKSWGLGDASPGSWLVSIPPPHLSPLSSGLGSKDSPRKTGAGFKEALQPSQAVVPRSSQWGVALGHEDKVRGAWGLTREKIWPERSSCARARVHMRGKPSVWDHERLWWAGHPPEGRRAREVPGIQGWEMELTCLCGITQSMVRKVQVRELLGALGVF